METYFRQRIEVGNPFLVGYHTYNFTIRALISLPSKSFALYFSAMGLIDFFIRDASREDLHRGRAFDDIDMVMSKRDGSLIPVAMNNGVHVCQQCGGQFVEDPTSPDRLVEFSCGGHGVRIGIHSRCVDKASRALQKRGDKGDLVHDMSIMHKARRALSRFSLKKPPELEEPRIYRGRDSR